MGKCRQISILVARLCARFAHDRAGAAAIIFALALIPMLGSVGVAVDYSRANSLRAKLQSGADAAALAAGKNQSGSEAERRVIANEVFAANATQLKFTDAYKLTYKDVDDGAASRVDVSAKVPTTISGLLGINEITVNVRAETGRSGGTMEIVMVVDTSGSMEGSRTSTLKKAARDLVKTLFGSENNHPSISIGIVPFAAAVNVGPENESASWMDRNAVAKYHFNNFGSKQLTRFEIYDELKNVKWDGCVEARPYPLDVDDSTPVSSNRDSYFVPLLAPDAPDTDAGWRKDDFINNYLSDDGGDCSRSDRADDSAKGRQERVCKYKGSRADTSARYGTKMGPNFLCDARPLTPLTNKKGDLNSAIGQLTSYGGTNIHEGVMWGWRVLSPGAPFTEGKPYSDNKNKKIMIVMTDGSNFHGAFNNMNGSWYSVYGYASEDRLGTGLYSTNQLVEAMNNRTLEACSNAKKKGIMVYTIAFDVNDRDTLAIMESCASSRSMAYNSKSTGDLLTAFDDIAKKLGELRLAK
ncbi:pilus assembly protein TadG-related protein [Tepidamorphus sp. 3E244]|uniref:pilus assembly protein TadG-related protein n=1 Tax=Tepidamorphus sp. 3E244 TaxID=3385498 RepID=UPI0038FD02CB